MITFHHKDDESEFVHGEITVTNDSPCSHDVVKSFTTFLLAVEYHPISIKRSFERCIEQLENQLHHLKHTEDL